MNLKLKNGLIKAISYTLSLSGIAAVVVFQYFTNHNPAPAYIKVLTPCMLALLVAFLVYYKALKQRINRKLTAIETAKELGKQGKTSSIVANLLETMGIVVPLILMGGIFVLGGKYLVRTGIVLFEILGMYTVIIIGNIICDFNTKQEIKKKEAEQAEAFADKIAEKIQKLPKKYE